MKKGIFAAAITSLVLMLSGCGGNMYPDSGSNGTGGDQNGTGGNGSNPMVKYHFENAKSLIVNKNGYKGKISIDLVDKNGVGVSGKVVMATSIPLEYGTIENSAVVTASNGRATFDYTGPSDITPLIGTSKNVTFIYQENNQSIRSSSNISFKFTSNNGGNDENASKITPIVVINNDYREINLTDNSQAQDIEVNVFRSGTNTPYTNGNVTVSLPNKVLDGVDVGSFDKYTVKVGENGKAIFHYTGPQNLKTLIDSGDKNSTFKFYHNDNPTQIATSTVIYAPKSGYVPANYILSTSSSDNNYTMNLNKLKTFTVYLKDDKGNLISDDNITSVKIESKNTLVGKLIDSSNNSEVDQLSFENSDATNKINFPIQTHTHSGLLPIKITVTFKDANNETKTLVKIMNLVVLSGPPTAMSISYAGVEQNKTIAKYIEKFAVAVTDKYNNPVNTTPMISTGAIVEYAVDGSSSDGKRTTTSPRLWHGRFDSNKGKLVPIGNNKAQFESNSSNTFKYVDPYNDRLVIFGSGYSYEALGKWDLDSINDSVLDLKDSYFGEERKGLYYAIGHNEREDLCSDDARKYVGTMKAQNGEYQLDSNGHALLEFEYDYHLTGKDIMVWANITGYQADDNKTGRIGTAIKHTLRGNGLISLPENGYSLDKNQTAVVSFSIWHKNAPEQYRNAKFGWDVKGGSTCKWTVVDSSNYYDARSCYGTNGRTYIKFRLQSPPDKGCTFNITHILPSGEF